MKTSMHFIAAIAFSWCPAIYANCLAEVTDFAHKICGEINTKGSSRIMEINGDLKAGVSGIVRRVLGEAGGEIEIKRVTREYENVLRKDLAKELSDIRRCKTQMVRVGISALCNYPSNCRVVASIKSAPKPKDGQKNRSSGNFSLQEPGDKVRWRITLNGKEVNGIKINIMEDKSLRKDPIIFRGIKNGTVTAVPRGRSIYVANPSGAPREFLLEACSS